MAKHIILMILDCLRQDYAYNPEFMPFLNELKNKSIWYEEAYAIAPATSFAMSSILTGKNPLEIENDWKITKNKKNHFLPNKTKEHYTQFITGNIMTSRRYGYDTGFNHFEDFLDKKSTAINIHSKRQKYNAIINKINKKIKLPKIIKKISKKICLSVRDSILHNPNVYSAHKIRFKDIALNFFNNLQKEKNTISILHFIDTHTPYCSIRIKDKKTIKKNEKITKKLYNHLLQDRKSSSTLTKKEILFLKENYEEEVRDLDKNLHEFFKKLKETISWENTLLIITADHGEAFGEKGYMNHPLNRVSNIHHIKVPFIIAGGLVKSIKIMPSENNIIWNKDAYQIITELANNKQIVKLKKNTATFGITKSSQEHIICSIFNAEQKIKLETEANLLEKKEFKELFSQAGIKKNDTIVNKIQV